MFNFVLFVILAAWIIYDVIATKRYLDDYGYDTVGVLVTFFLGAPIDLVKWIASKV